MLDTVSAKLRHPARLRALYALGLLDTPPEPAFDRLTRLATRLLHAPIALITLVDAERQFFKSTSGLPRPYNDIRETPLSYSFCQYAVVSGQPLVVSDAREDPILQGNPAIDELGIVAYAGIPLLTPEGHAIGALCVCGPTPRGWTDTELADLADLAASVTDEIVLHSLLTRQDEPEITSEAALSDGGGQSRTEPALIRAARQRLREYSALYSASSAIASSLNLPTVLQRIVERLGKAVNATSAYICSYDAETRDITIASAYLGPGACEAERISDLSAPSSVRRTFPTSALTLRSAQPNIFQRNGPGLTPAHREQMQKYGAQTILEIPLVVRGQVVAYAALWDSRRRREYSDREIALCQVIAQYAAVAIENAGLYEQARENERRYRTLARSVPDAVVSLYNQELCHILVEGAQPTLFGIAKEQLVGRTVWEALPQRVAAILAELYRSALTGTPAHHELHYQGRSYAISALPVTEEQSAQTNGLAIIQDITVWKTAEDERLLFTQQLLEARNQESLSVLAGGIAHVFNNMLAVIMGYAELALLDLPPDAPLRETITPIIKTAQRAADLTAQIQTYSGRRKGSSQVVDLNLIVESVPGLLAQVIPPFITLALNTAPDLPPVIADVTAVQQLLHQLVTNAIEAIGERSGQITITTDVCMVDTADLSAMDFASSRSAGAYVRLHITDTGDGMDSATRQRIFQPFFSTKFAGRGLGLPAALGIVRSHNGAISVQSELGLGTTVTVLFPEAAPESTLVE